MNKSEVRPSKIVSYEEFIDIRKELREEGLKVVHSHGVFDLLHPGHIAHLEEAKKLGDILVVSITSTPYVNKGPGRPYFSDELRLKSIAALECVDYVILSKSVTALEVIEVIQPDLYIKGKEYSKSEDDITQNIDKEAEKARAYGGDVYFTENDIVFSSTKLINNSFSVFPEHVKSYMKEFTSKYSFDSIRNLIEQMRDLKVMVVGDIIIDEYVFCQVQGLMSKDRAFSAKYIGEERYLGGSLAVAKHLAGFSNNVTVCGIVGNEPHIHSKILNDLSSIMFLDLQFNNMFDTVVKRRYIEQRGIRSEFDKLFSVNYLTNSHKNEDIDRQPFYDRLNRNVHEYDIVIITDYGHGLLDRKAMEILQNKAKFLAVNCQTNSSNFGTNLITKYDRADTYTLDEREIRLAFGSQTDKLDELLARLNQKFSSDAGWLTLGSRGAMGIDRYHQIKQSPALTLTVQDTVGAGDAFFALSSLCAKMRIPVEIGTFLGNIAGAIEANVLGNSKSVNKIDLLKFASTMMNV